jgi:hypothetical protein
MTTAAFAQGVSEPLAAETRTGCHALGIIADPLAALASMGLRRMPSLA